MKYLQKTSMISLQKKIARPYIALIIAIPLGILFLFNISMEYFSGIQAQQDLKKIYTRLQDTSPHVATLEPLVQLYRAKHLAMATELVLFSPLGKLAKSSYFSELSLNEATALAAYVATVTKRNGEIIAFAQEGVSYYAMKVQTEIHSKPVFAIYVSHGNFSSTFVAFINKILLGISLIVIVVALGISRKVSNALVQPLKNIITHVDNATYNNPVIIESTTNIAELETLSQRINHMGQRIYTHSEEQKKFLHNASHELRTPLMSIQGYVQGIEHNMFADNTQAILIIKNETQRLSDLVNELLTLSRMENVEQNKNLEPLSIQKMIHDSVLILQGYALKAEKELHLELFDDAEVLCNEELFFQVVTNIISNAIRFAQNRIIIRQYVSGNQAILEIKDDGNGIAEKDLPYIFDKFYRGEKGNFGLGLSISMSAMQAMGGKLCAQNAPPATGGGAIFKIVLPTLQ